MNNIKKLIISLICLPLMIVMLTSIKAEESGVSLEIDIRELDDKFVVEILDDDYYREYKPTVFVNTNYDDAVYVYDDYNFYVCTIENGQVNFVVSKGGTYYISDIKPTLKNHYLVPETGIE